MPPVVNSRSRKKENRSQQSKERVSNKKELLEFCFFLFVSFDISVDEVFVKIVTFLNFAILENESETEYKTSKPKRRSFWYFSIMKSTLWILKH